MSSVLVIARQVRFWTSSKGDRIIKLKHDLSTKSNRLKYDRFACSNHVWQEKPAIGKRELQCVMPRSQALSLLNLHGIAKAAASVREQ